MPSTIRGTRHRHGFLLVAIGLVAVAAFAGPDPRAYAQSNDERAPDPPPSDVPTLDEGEFDALFDEDDGDGSGGGLGGAFRDTVTFAGTAQLDYLWVPTDDRARDLSFDGFTTELSLKVSADVSEHVTVEVKTCFGCHGFELGSALVDVRPFPEMRLRAGKFVPKFGDFPVRHDPANHLTSDKPLPYDMGRMLRLRDWNMSVLPAPYVDNGFEVSFRHGVGDHVDIDYAVYALGGLRGGNEAVDVDFIQSRSSELYYVDNNSEPAVGGRLAMAARLGEDAFLSLGSSAMWGHYDPDRELSYLILGGDLVFKFWRATLRAEYLLRRTRMALGENPGERFQYGPGSDGEFDPYNLKDGFYAEFDVPLWQQVLELVLRFDGMRRMGNVLQGSTLRSESAVMRYTGGLNYVFADGYFRVKASGEFYDFSDFSDEFALHLGLVGTF